MACNLSSHIYASQNQLPLLPLQRRSRRLRPREEPDIIEEEVDTEDYTKAADLKKLLSAFEKPATHTIVAEHLLGINCNEFFDLYLADGAKKSQALFFERKGEKEVSCDEWTDPVTPEEKVYDGKPVLKQRQLKMKVNVNSTFVKVAPTTKYYKLIERTPTRIVMRCLARTNDIPYCTTFGVEEEWYVASPAGENVKCGVLRMSYAIIWYQSTLMKSVIKSSTDPETKKVMGEWMDEIVEQNKFVEKQPVPKPATTPKTSKRPLVIDQRATAAQKGRISHKVEPGNKLVHDQRKD